MKKEQTTFQKQLEQEKKTVLGELNKIGVVKDERNPDDWQAVPGDVDILESDSNEVSDKIETYEGNNALVHDLEQRLMDIDAALDRMKKGTYGLCEVCKKPIEEDRLKANPAARTCKQHMK